MGEPNKHVEVVTVGNTPVEVVTIGSPEPDPVERIQKLVDRDEAVEWLSSGMVTYGWIIEEYERKYGIATSPSYWGNVKRALKVVQPRRDFSPLVPWAMRDLIDGYAREVSFLRAEMQLRWGMKTASAVPETVATWKAERSAAGEVVHYDPDAEYGHRWSYVPRRPGIDHDLIREPDERIVAAS